MPAAARGLQTLSPSTAGWRARAVGSTGCAGPQQHSFFLVPERRTEAQLAEPASWQSHSSLATALARRRGRLLRSCRRGGTRKATQHQTFRRHGRRREPFGEDSRASGLPRRMGHRDDDGAAPGPSLLHGIGSLPPLCILHASQTGARRRPLAVHVLPGTKTFSSALSRSSGGRHHGLQAGL